MDRETRPDIQAQALCRELRREGYLVSYPVMVKAMQAAALRPEAQHPDDEAVDRFAAAMKAKLAKKRGDGRGGWEGPDCSGEFLSDLLREHLEKGDPLDVGNFAMMLHQRGERISALDRPEAQDGVAEAAQAVISARFSTYKARNGREVGIEDDNGEMCWIVPFEEMDALERAISTIESEQDGVASAAKVLLDMLNLADGVPRLDREETEILWRRVQDAGGFGPVREFLNTLSQGGK